MREHTHTQDARFRAHPRRCTFRVTSRVTVRVIRANPHQNRNSAAPGRQIRLKSESPSESQFMSESGRDGREARPAGRIVSGRSPHRLGPGLGRGDSDSDSDGADCVRPPLARPHTYTHTPACACACAGGVPAADGDHPSHHARRRQNRAARRCVRTLPPPPPSPRPPGNPPPSPAPPTPTHTSTSHYPSH